MGTRMPSDAEAPGDLEPVEVGEHDVEDDQVGGVLLSGERRGAR